MRIQPVPHYRPPALPLAAWNRTDPCEHAARGGALLRLMARAGLLGSSLLASTGCQGGEADPAPAVAPPPTHPMVLGASIDAVMPQTPDEAAAALLRLAPNIVDALVREGLGRGGMGCVAVDPPSFVTESEGVEVVRAALAEAGLDLAPAGAGPTIQGVLLPFVPSSGAAVMARDKKPPPPFQARPGDFSFDGASRDGRVVFEFISREDHRALQDRDGRYSTAEFVDLGALAQRLAEGLARTPDPERRIAVLVFDPMTKHSVVENDPTPQRPRFLPENYPDCPKREDFDSSKAFWEAYYEASQTDPRFQADLKVWREAIQRRTVELARENIRRQLAPQIDYLREQGVLPNAQP